MLEPQRLDRVPSALADDVELALERVGDHDARAAAHQYLPDCGLQALRRFGEIGIVHRHVAPAEQHLALVLDGALDLILAGEAARWIARQEHHADPVLPRGRQLDAAPGHFLAQQLVRDLDQAACAIGELRIPAHRAAVGKVLQHREAVLDDRVRLLSLDMRDEANAARIVLVSRVVQSLRVRQEC